MRFHPPKWRMSSGHAWYGGLFGIDQQEPPWLSHITPSYPFLGVILGSSCVTSVSLRLDRNGVLRLTSCHKCRHTEQWTLKTSGRQILTVERVYSGYDFGYFIKLLTALSLPTTEDAFFKVLKTWFPTSYDIKTMMRASKLLKGGLQDVADDLGVRTFLSHP